MHIPVWDPNLYGSLDIILPIRSQSFFSKSKPSYSSIGLRTTFVRGWFLCPVMFHITQLKRGDNFQQICEGDVSPKSPKIGTSIPTPEFVLTLQARRLNKKCWSLAVNWPLAWSIPVSPSIARWVRWLTSCVVNRWWILPGVPALVYKFMGQQLFVFWVKSSVDMEVSVSSWG